MPDLSLILSPFVYCAWGALRLWLPFLFFLFFHFTLLGRGGREGAESLFVVLLLAFLLPSQPLPSLLPRLKLQGLSASLSFVLFILAAFLPGFSYLLGVCIPFTSPF